MPGVATVVEPPEARAVIAEWAAAGAVRPAGILPGADVAQVGEHGDGGGGQLRFVDPEDLRGLGEIGQVIQHRHRLAEQPPRAEREHGQEGEHEGDPDEEPGPPRQHQRYLAAPAAAHSATTARASGGSTTVATPGMLAMSRLSP